jgi:hypothetical protein
METAKMLKKMKNTKMIIAGYSPNRNWWNLIGTTSTWISQKNRNRLNCHCKAMADITPPHYFGTSVSMVMPFWILSTRHNLPHTTVNIPGLIFSKLLPLPKCKKKWKTQKWS